MSHSIKSPEELRNIYRRRFDRDLDYRRTLWRTLTEHCFQRYVRPTDTVLDLGCGYGEFINAVRCGRKLAMDLNPEAERHLESGVQLLRQDCSEPWNLPDGSLDVVFTSNFFEHLPDKLALRRTILEGCRCMRQNGLLLALGPNIKFVPGKYWDFWDHFLCLTDLSLGEALENNGFTVIESHPRFLPYSTVGAPRFPAWVVKAYLAQPWLWRLFGKQFFVVARKTA